MKFGIKQLSFPEKTIQLYLPVGGGGRFVIAAQVGTHQCYLVTFGLERMTNTAHALIILRVVTDNKNEFQQVGNLGLRVLSKILPNSQYPQIKPLV